MANIKQLEDVPEISFIENMTLQETENLVLEQYSRLYRELVGEEPSLGDADPKMLLIKAFSLVLYQVMQYIDAKGRAELLKTSTGSSLDNLAALLGIQRSGAARASSKERFTLSEPRRDFVAIPAGTRVKTQGGKYFNTLAYAQIPPGETYTDITIQAEEAGAGSSGILEGDINVLVDPIPYIASVTNIEPSAGGIDMEDDASLTERLWLAPSKFSSAGPRDAYEYYVREWRSDVEDVQIVTPEPCVVSIYVVLDGGRLPNQTERESLEAYITGEEMRPLCDRVICLEPEEIPYTVDFTYWIGSGSRKSAGTIQDKISAAVSDYQVWQRKLGRDINPTELIARVRDAGAKRVRLASPEDTVILRTQLPKCAGVNIIYGGLEDD